MTKKNSLTHIPMVPNIEYNTTTKKFESNGTLRALTYVNEPVYLWDEAANKTVSIDPIYFPNTPFEDTLIYNCYYKGRSAAGTVFKNAQGQIFHVFMSDFHVMIKQMVKGQITGKFIYVKEGANYGLKLADS